jgi:hypothetical protein
MLETDRHDGPETLQQTSDRGAGLSHPNEDLARLSIRVEPYGQVALVTCDGEVVVDGRAFILQTMTVRCRRT